MLLRTRQNLFYATLCLAVAATAVLGYRAVNPQWVFYRQAENRLAAGDPAGAASLYVRAVRAGMVLGPELERLGRVYLERGEMPLSAPVFRVWLEQRPDDRQARLTLAELLAYDGRFDESLAQIDDALAEQPGWRTALSMKARVLTWAGRLDEAITTYRRYLGVTP